MFFCEVEIVGYVIVWELGIVYYIFVCFFLNGEYFN